MSATIPRHWQEVTAASAELRRARSEVKRQIRRGHLCPADVLRDPPACVEGMRVFELLEAAPFVGPTKIAQLNLAAAQRRINVMRPVGSLSARSREWLIEQMPPLLARRHDFRERGL